MTKHLLPSVGDVYEGPAADALDDVDELTETVEEAEDEAEPEAEAELETDAELETELVAEAELDAEAESEAEAEEETEDDGDDEEQTMLPPVVTHSPLLGQSPAMVREHWGTVDAGPFTQEKAKLLSRGKRTPLASFATQ